MWSGADLDKNMGAFSSPTLQGEGAGRSGFLFARLDCMKALDEIKQYENTIAA